MPASSRPASYFAAVFLAVIGTAIGGCPSAPSPESVSPSSSGDSVVVELEHGKPPHYKGAGPSAPQPATEHQHASPLAPAVRKLESQWFRPGEYTHLSTGQRLDLGVVLVGTDPDYGQGVSRLDDDGTLRWHWPGLVKNCRLTEAQNLLCQLDGTDYALFDDVGREVWRRDLSEHVADPAASSGFGTQSFTTFVPRRMRVVDDFAYVELVIDRSDAAPTAKPEFALLCLSLGGSLRWSAGGLPGVGLAAERAHHAFLSPPERARRYVENGIPDDPWQARPLPRATKLDAFVGAHTDWLSVFAVDQGWLLIAESGPLKKQWRRKTFVRVSSTGQMLDRFEFDAPHSEAPLYISDLVEAPTGQVFALWYDGRITEINVGQHLPLTHGRGLVTFTEGDQSYLLIRRFDAPPAELPERAPGLELFALVASPPASQPAPSELVSPAAAPLGSRHGSHAHVPPSRRGQAIGQEKARAR